MTHETTIARYVKPAFTHAALPLLTAADVPKTTLMEALYRACRSRRADDSMAEAKFVAWLVNRVAVTMIDGAGNIHVDTRTLPKHRTMFTSHTDTVHRNGGTNAIRLDESNPESIKWRADEGHCLGADDGAGVALMLHMLAAGVPGLYVFFRGEECGGTGSHWLSRHMRNYLEDIDRCVSLDRAGYSDVVTHQGSERCCSDEFAQALADQLTADDLSTAYVPDSTGVFTDSANLTGLVHECTNVSVGYMHQHGDGEWQDVTFLQTLASRLVAVDWDGLPVKRDRLVREMLPRVKKTKPAPNTAPPALNMDLILALYAASEGDYTALMDMVAADMAVTPDNIAIARKHLDPRKVSDQNYMDFAEAMLQNQIDAGLVLDLLADDLYVD